MQLCEQLDLRCRRPGDVIMLTTGVYIYTLTLLNAGTRVCTLKTTDPRVHGTKTVRVLESIVKGSRLALKFANGVLDTPPVTSARIEGRDWFYHVF